MAAPLRFVLRRDSASATPRLWLAWDTATSRVVRKAQTRKEARQQVAELNRGLLSEQQVAEAE